MPSIEEEADWGDDVSASVQVEVVEQAKESLAAAEADVAKDEGMIDAIRTKKPRTDLQGPALASSQGAYVAQALVNEIKLEQSVRDLRLEEEQMQKKLDEVIYSYS